MTPANGMEIHPDATVNGEDKIAAFGPIFEHLSWLGRQTRKRK